MHEGKGGLHSTSAQTGLLLHGSGSDAAGEGGGGSNCSGGNASETTQQGQCNGASALAAMQMGSQHKGSAP